jgi:hypothetical protein
LGSHAAAGASGLKRFAPIGGALAGAVVGFMILGPLGGVGGALLGFLAGSAIARR